MRRSAAPLDPQLSQELTHPSNLVDQPSDHTTKLRKPASAGQLPRVFGRKPWAHPAPAHRLSNLSPADPTTYYTVANVVWSILVGWWCAVFVLLSGCLLVLTIFARNCGFELIRLSRFIIFPFGKQLHMVERQEMHLAGRIVVWIVLSIFFVIPLFLGAAISWELIFFLPMARYLVQFLVLIMTTLPSCAFVSVTEVESLQSLPPSDASCPTVVSAGSFANFGYELYEMDIVYLNLFPLCLLCLYLGYLAPDDSPLKNPIVGTMISITSTIPCMYVIGVCTEVLSGRCGLVLGSVINAALTGFVELILFSFSLRKGLGDVVMASVTGAFLMNLLVIPGLAIIAAGFKDKEVALDRKIQTVSSTFMLMVIVAVFFPTVLYRFYGDQNIDCAQCDSPSDSFFMNCSRCGFTPIALEDDPAYSTMARPFVFVVSAFLPVLYIIAIVFSLKTHRYIWENIESQMEDEEAGSTPLPTAACIVLLAINCTLFSVICEVLTDNIGEASEQMHLTPRFVGLVFFTVIPALAEFINAVRFAWDGHLGLSLEIGSQGAMVVSLIQMPALVLISELMGGKTAHERFTLIFAAIDVYAIIIAVLLRNMMLMEKSSASYLTGFAFLVIFFFIAVVYFYLSD
jgi:Ca2+:H+ antiporter